MLKRILIKKYLNYFAVLFLSISTLQGQQQAYLEKETADKILNQVIEKQKPPKSIVFTPQPISASLVEAQNYLDEKFKNFWNNTPSMLCVQGYHEFASNNETQKMFLSTYFADRFNAHLKDFTPEELKTKASDKCNDVNDFLKTNGFEIQLKQGSMDAFYIAAILNVATTWQKEGIDYYVDWYRDRCDVIYPGDMLTEYYKAVKLSYDKPFKLYSTKEHPYEIIEIPTQSNDIVYMTLSDGSNLPTNDFALAKKIQQLAKNKKITASTSEAIFPQISLTDTKSLDWLVSLDCLAKTITTPFGIDGDIHNHPDIATNKVSEISQALQETHFSMDTKGTKVRSACALTFTKCFYAKSHPFVIEKPFYLWIERNGEIYFYAYLDQDTWVKRYNNKS